jgi:hypothetical protein
MKSRSITVLILLILNTTYVSAQADRVPTVVTPQAPSISQTTAPNSYNSNSQESPPITHTTEITEPTQTTTLPDPASQITNPSSLETSLEAGANAVQTSANNSTSETIALVLSKEQIKNLIKRAAQSDPYQVSCAPQTLNTSIKNNYSAYTVAVFYTKRIEATTGNVNIFAMNATLPTVAGITKKTVMGSVIGKGLAIALGTLPSFLTVATNGATTSYIPSFVSLTGTTVPVLISGSSEYEDSRISMRELRYYDGIFRTYDLYLARINTFNNRHARKEQQTLTNSALYNKLPMYANMLISKQSNDGKPIIQITNTVGKSWSYSLSCDNQREMSRERHQVLDLIEKLKSVVNLPAPE